MASFDTLPEINSRVSELINKLTSAKLSKEELEELETLSRRLYERALILNYKAKEENVYGDTSKKEEAMDATFPFAKQENEIQEEPSTSKTESETSEAEKSLENEEITESPEEPLEKESSKTSKVEPDSTGVQKEEGVEFDFSGGFGTPKPEQQAAKKDSTVEEKPEETEKAIEEKAPKGTSQEEMQEIASEKSVDKESATPSLNEMLQKEDNEDDSSSYYEHFLKSYNLAIGDKLSTSKINSLKDAIGLNDKLQFISELFGGDANRYNDSVESLDQLESSEAALKKLSEIAAQENWNKKDASVDEFAHLITRRYVE